MKFFKKLFKSQPISFYKSLGEETGVYELVRNFYDTMETDPHAHDCLVIHKLDEQGLVNDDAKKKLFMFLSGWFGGPNLFVENFGHPRMRARHMHIKIGEKEREQWIYCMEKSMKMHSKKIKKKEYKLMLNSFIALSMRIKNLNSSSM